MTRRIIVFAMGAAVALAGSLGCTTKIDAPPLTGPSELSTSIAVYANPDSLARNGAAQSQITIQARNASNQPIPSLTLTLATRGLDALGRTVVGDVGQLSASQMTTGGDGRASVYYNAPNTALNTLVSVMILVTPVGADASGALPRSVTIRLTSAAIANPPIASFTFLPAAPIGDQSVYFNASASSPGSSPISSYSWDFGDGSRGSGIVQSHSFNGCSGTASNTTSGIFVVRLTVADLLGSSTEFATVVTVLKCKP
ncbi:MAG: PKD domain-containing protein [Acidobacteria bacterium]|nr:PKD domain-containing protein [Acidobacteriota bacterium]